MADERRVIELRTPADEQSAILIRMTTAGALAYSGISLDEMEDAKLAAEEACKCLIRSCGCGELAIRYIIDKDKFTLDADGLMTSDCACEGLSDEEVGVIRYVLLSMMDTVELVFDDKCLRGIRMAKSLRLCQ
ncbi:MAG: hypothetical protein Q4D04_02465 [Clostridia bacterium]|nr:hypothetical protein [Clostridia bacterium]